MIRPLASIVVLAWLGGCGDSTGLEGIETGSPASESCLVPPIIDELHISGNAGLAPQFDNPAEHVIFTRADLTANGGAFLSLSLWEGAGALANGFQTGTYVLTGKETELRSCGICLSIAAAANATGVPRQSYFAFWGLVTIRDLVASGGGVLSARIEDLRLKQVKYDAAGQQLDVDSGCWVLVDSVELEMSVQDLAARGRRRTARTESESPRPE